jgi:GAF domain-containing protein
VQHAKLSLARRGPSTHEAAHIHRAILLGLTGSILAGPGRKGTSDCADEVTLSRKGAKSRTGARKLRSTGTKVRTRVGRNREPHAELEQQLEACRRELAGARGHLTEALEQQTATSEVLSVISSSPGELGPVFQAMLENATRLCEANFGMMFLYEHGAFRPAALLGAPPALSEFVWRRGSFEPNPGSPLGRVLETRRVVHRADAAAEQVPGASAKVAGARSLVAVPMLKENDLIGAIVIYRQEVRPSATNRSSW